MRSTVSKPMLEHGLFASSRLILGDFNSTMHLRTKAETPLITSEIGRISMTYLSFRYCGPNQKAIMKTIVLALLSFSGSYAASLPPVQTDLFPIANNSLTSLTFVNGSISSPTLLQLQGQSSNEDIENFEYRIPNTHRFLTIALHKNAHIDDFAFSRVISMIIYRAQRHIDNHGDGPFLPQDNPYHYGIRGCQSTTFSRTGFGALLMTYGMLKEVMYGLRVVLEAQRRFNVAAYVLWDEHGIAYGEGEINDESTTSKSQ